MDSNNICNKSNHFKELFERQDDFNQRLTAIETMSTIRISKVETDVEKILGKLELLVDALNGMKIESVNNENKKKEKMEFFLKSTLYGTLITFTVLLILEYITGGIIK